MIVRHRGRPGSCRPPVCIARGSTTYFIFISQLFSAEEERGIVTDVGDARGYEDLTRCRRKPEPLIRTLRCTNMVSVHLRRKNCGTRVLGVDQLLVSDTGEFMMCPGMLLECFRVGETECNRGGQIANRDHNAVELQESTTANGVTCREELCLFRHVAVDCDDG